MTNTILASEYCDRIFDGTHETPKPSQHGRPLVTSKNIVGGTLDKTTTYNISEEDYQGIQRRSYVSQWDVLFSMIGSVGEVYIEKSPEIDYAVKNVGVFSCLDESRAMWLYFYLKSATAQKIIRNQLNGAVQKFLSLGTLRNFPVPSFDSSKKPAIHLLSALDSKIALNQRINSELEGMAKLLYDYWFVQYDFPLSAAQAAALGKPRLAGKPYRTSGGPMVFEPQLKREVPKGWKVGSLSELCHLNHRTWPNKDHPAQVTYLDLANAKNGEILSVQKFVWNEAPSRARRILTPGDTILGTVRPGNRSFALVPKSEEILTGSTGFAVLTPKSATYREFNYLSLTSESNINRLTTVASGAAYPAVNPEVVAAQTIAIPTADLIQQFHQITASFFDLIERHRAQNQELTILRDWLLPMLMNGQVRVG